MRDDCIYGSEVLVEQYGDPCVACGGHATERSLAFVQLWPERRLPGALGLSQHHHVWVVRRCNHVCQVCLGCGIAKASDIYSHQPDLFHLLLQGRLRTGDACGASRTRWWLLCGLTAASVLPPAPGAGSGVSAGCAAGGGSTSAVALPGSGGGVLPRLRLATCVAAGCPGPATALGSRVGATAAGGCSCAARAAAVLTSASCRPAGMSVCCWVVPSTIARLCHISFDGPLAGLRCLGQAVHSGQSPFGATCLGWCGLCRCCGVCGISAA